MVLVWAENIAVGASILATNINEIQDNVDIVYAFLGRNFPACAGAAWTEMPVAIDEIIETVQPVQLRERIDDLWDNVCTVNNVGEDVGENINEKTGANNGEDTGENVGADTGENVGADTGENVGANTGENVGEDTGEDVGADSGADIGNQVGVLNGNDGSDYTPYCGGDEFDNIGAETTNWGGGNCAADLSTVFDVDGCFVVYFDDH